MIARVGAFGEIGTAAFAKIALRLHDQIGGDHRIGAAVRHEDRDAGKPTRCCRPCVERNRAAEKHRTGESRRIVEYECAGRHHTRTEADEVGSPAIEFRSRVAVDPRAHAVNGGAQAFGDRTCDTAIFKPAIPAFGQRERATQARICEPARKLRSQVDKIVFVGAATVQQDDERRGATALRGPAPNDDGFRGELLQW